MNPMLYLLSMTCAHPCYFPHISVCSKVAQKIDEERKEFPEGGASEFSEKCLAYVPLVSCPYENGAWRLVTVPRYSNISVNIAMYTSSHDTVFDILHSVIVCVDFLGTHMANLVLFFKTGCDNKQELKNMGKTIQAN
jgi:hypothetical protein